MIVFRVQNEKGYGPYQHFGSDWCDEHHSAYNGRPMPWDDEIGHPPGTHRYGFDSMIKLMQWFSVTELNKLYARGYRVVSFEVAREHVLVGGKQLAFHVDHASPMVEVCRTAELTYAPEAA